MDRIYANSEEKFVKTTILYISKEEWEATMPPGVYGPYVHAFEDPECLKPVSEKTLLDLFLKGVVFRVPSPSRDDDEHLPIDVFDVYGRAMFGVVVATLTEKPPVFEIAGSPMPWASDWTVIPSEVEVSDVVHLGD